MGLAVANTKNGPPTTTSSTSSVHAAGAMPSGGRHPPGTAIGSSTSPAATSAAWAQG
ncbi:MAG: hypothetical protein ACRDZ1_11550 [Acidimicrobiia bacterium]